VDRDLARALVIRAFRRLAALVLAALAALASPASAKDELVIGITQFPSSLHPGFDPLLAKTYVLAMTRRPFTVYDQSWKLTCLLCVELPTIANGGAKLTADGGIEVTYTIQEDATWGDGTPVTTRDVLFTWEVGRHPRTAIGAGEFFRRIVAIDAMDDRTFTLHFDRASYEYNAINDFELLPAHLEAKAFADPDSYRTRTTFDTDPTRKGLFFGPYRIAEVRPGSHIALERNPTWHGEAPHFRRIVVRVVENSAALEANLLSGAIDYIPGELGLTLDQALAFARRHGGRFDIVYKPGLKYEHIPLNLEHPALADIRVRQALLHAIDRETLTTQLFDGRQPVAHSFVSPLDPVVADDVPVYRFDPARAAALLDAAGWSVRKGGIRHSAAGDRLSLELLTTTEDATRRTVQQVLQSQWRKSGIEVRLKNEPARVLIGETMRKRDFTMAMYFSFSSPEGNPRGFLHSRQVPAEANNFAGQNRAGLRDPASDALIEKIEATLDPAPRRALWRELQHRYAVTLPALPLYFRTDPYILPKWLTGIEPTGHQGVSTLWVERWRPRS
jgi:peptide/nickel transport system substrate-binding protein